MKKIRGKIHYFGRWAKRVNGKLERIEGDAGRTPRVEGDGLTVADLSNHFLTAKLRKRDFS